MNKQIQDGHLETYLHETLMSSICLGGIITCYPHTSRGGLGHSIPGRFPVTFAEYVVMVSATEVFIQTLAIDTEKLLYVVCFMVVRDTPLLVVLEIPLLLVDTLRFCSPSCASEDEHGDRNRLVRPPTRTPTFSCVSLFLSSMSICIPLPPSISPKLAAHRLVQIEIGLGEWQRTHQRRHRPRAASSRFVIAYPALCHPRATRMTRFASHLSLPARPAEHNGYIYINIRNKKGEKRTKKKNR